MKKIICGWVVMVLLLSAMIAVYASAAVAQKTVTPRYGGTLKWISSQVGVNIGVPWIPSPEHASEMIVRAPCVETLLRLDEKGNLIPWLATGWKFSQDLKSVTFTLRQGVKFHDGTDFNAKTVKYNLDKYRTSPCGELKVVTSVDIVDDYTVRLNLSEFQAFFLSYFALNPGEMVSPTSIEAHDDLWNKSHSVGTGPFKFASYEPSVALKWVKFDGYWQKGKPYLDAIESVVVVDRTVAKFAFKMGQGHVVSANIRDAIELQKEGKYVICSTPAGTVSIAGDSANPDSPFADIRIRRAVSYAIDNEAIAKSFGPGFIRPFNQPAALESWAYNKAVVGYPYNPDKAKALLKEAGYPNGFKTKLIYQSTAPSAMYMPAYQGYLKAVGIDAELQGVQNILFNQICTGGWKNGLILVLVPTRVGYDPGMVLRDCLSSKSPNYPSILHPADYEAKLAQSIAEPDFEKRKTLTQQAIKMAIDDYCLLNCITQDLRVNVQYPVLQDLRNCQYWFHMYTPADAWLSE